MFSSHPPYSPDLVSTDYHLFCTLSKKMQNKEFENEDDIEKFLKSFFDSLEQEFAKAFDELLRRWIKLIEKHGEYIVD